MPSTKLTPARVEKLKAPTVTGKPEIHWDTKFRFFGVRCNAKESIKSYVVQCKVKGTKKERRVTIGQVGVWEFDDAITEALRLAGLMSKGIDPKAGNKASEAEAFTVKDALEYFERHTKARKTTKDEYRRIVETWLDTGPDYVKRKLPSWLDLTLVSITRDDVLERHALIQKTIAGANRDERVTGNSVADGTMRVLRLLYNEADRKYDTLPKNPVRMKGKWYGTNARTSFVEDPDKPAFFDAVLKLENTVQRDAVLFMLFSGLRVGATCALRWDQIDLKQGNFTLCVEDQKGKFEQTLPLGLFLHEKLIARRAIGNPGGWVFPSNRGKTGHICDPKGCVWGAIEKEIGLRYMNHDLRRTWATVLAEVAPNQTVYDYLTHHKPVRVSDRYAQLKPDRLRPFVQRATDLMIEMCSIQEIVGENVVPLDR